MNGLSGQFTQHRFSDKHIAARTLCAMKMVNTNARTRRKNP